MSKKIIVARGRARQKLVKKYHSLRKELKTTLSERFSLKEQIKVRTKIQELPRNRAPRRLCNRCILSGRSRGYYRTFGVSRHFFRNLSQQGELPGIRKSSW